MQCGDCAQSGKGASSNDPWKNRASHAVGGAANASRSGVSDALEFRAKIARCLPAVVAVFGETPGDSPVEVRWHPGFERGGWGGVLVQDSRDEGSLGWRLE